jgi:hypothetical protein
MKLLDDTRPEARRVLIQAFTAMPPLRKWRIVEDAIQTSRIVHAAGVRSRRPAASDEDVRRDWVSRVLLAPFVEGPLMPPTMSESLDVLREAAAVFRRMGIAHALGGSMASSLYGVPRQTLDADFTAEPFPGREAEFAAHFGEAYYVNIEAIRDAIRRRASFNVVNLHVGFKIDVFIQGERPYDDEALRRRIEQPLSEKPGDTVSMLAPEDVILHKLDWYRIGGETSDRQWADILGVMRVQAGRLDETYLEHWANELSLNDLLRKAREQAQE